MKIKIHPSNKTAIEKALADVNGKATSFTISTAGGVCYVARKAEEKLTPLPKQSRKGAEAIFVRSGPTSGTYKYDAKSTLIKIVRGANDWFLTGVFATEVHPRQAEKMGIYITQAQAAEIQRRSIADFTVTQA